MAETMLVRIKPYNPKKGHLRRTHIEQKWGMRFKVEGGWYEVPAVVARDLRKVLQNPDDPESAEVFDVMTKAQAQEVRQYEELKIEKIRATPDAPTKLTIRRPKDQRSPDASDVTDLAEEVPTVPTRARAETRAENIAKEIARSTRGYEVSEGFDGEADFAPPYGVPDGDDDGAADAGSDPFDADLSDVEGAMEPPTVKFDDETSKGRRGRGRPRRA